MKLNKRQTIVIGVGVILLVALGLMPPWQNKGYGFLFDPPSRRYSIAFGLLILEWFLLAVVTTSAVFLLRNKQKSSSGIATPGKWKRILARQWLMVLSCSFLIVLALGVITLIRYNLARKRVQKVDVLLVGWRREYFGTTQLDALLANLNIKYPNRMRPTEEPDKVRKERDEFSYRALRQVYPNQTSPRSSFRDDDLAVHAGVWKGFLNHLRLWPVLLLALYSLCLFVCSIMWSYKTLRVKAAPKA